MDSPDTVTEAVAFLEAAGYRDTLSVRNGLDRAVVDYTFRFEGPSDPADEATDVMVPSDRWRAFVGRWGPPRPVLRYDDPAWVAERLHLMLQRRPRLAFDAAQIPTVASVLAQHAARVRTASTAVFDATIYDAATKSR